MNFKDISRRDLLKLGAVGALGAAGAKLVRPDWTGDPAAMVCSACPNRRARWPLHEQRHARWLCLLQCGMSTTALLSATP